MAKEVETKILDVDKSAITALLKSLGAKKVINTKLQVYWFKQKSQKNAKWYLRIRKYSDGKNEVTWKGKSTVHGISRSHKEINFNVADFASMFDLFKELGLENYAFQEKYRTSWTLKNWRFDLDIYPGMPPYLEIEGKNEAAIQKAVKLLKLEDYEYWSDGEKTLIENKYKLNWSLMKFK